ncbi:hypothetical protein [Bradyrhizobium yuanmingense]|uniref:hypothetical protein n=1 Tax=Bradyrhizobium yuanmingense TaxID=108015 RepID=UPI0031BA401E
MVSPKAGIVLGPWLRTELYCNVGYGLHSNDIRGATIVVDPNDKVTQLDRVPLLVRSRGAEVGIRTKPVEGLTSSVALFVDSELLFVGDAGTTEPSRPSRRMGVEWVNQYKPLPWLSFDLDVAYTRARFTNPVGDCIPGAPAWVGSAAITFGNETGWYGALKARYFGPRPLIEDDSSDLSHRSSSIRARDIGSMACVSSSMCSISSTHRQTYLSRLPGEPVDSVADRHIHPAEPRAVRLTVGARF